MLRGLAVWLTALGVVLGCWSAADQPATAASGTTVTKVTVDGRRVGARFWGVGAISGGGGNSRLLIDYPEPQRSQILDDLFRPNYGATLQLLKLEIGGDSNASVGAEPSIEPEAGHRDCNSGYEWWLAEQAVARNPNIKLYGLQWGAPGWVAGTGGTGTFSASRQAPRAVTSDGLATSSRSLWTQADIDYVLSWLDCARSHGLTISYLGGWNERFRPTTDRAGVLWYEKMRAALDAHGYRQVKLVAADEVGPERWSVADVMAKDPAFNAAVDVIGVHDACGYPPGDDGDKAPFGYHCGSSATARGLHKPMWASEDGKMDAGVGAPTMMRQLINSYNHAGITGVLEYPLVTAMVDDLPMENRGLVTAKWPWSGQFRVNRIAWSIAHITQFVPQGWHYVRGANRSLGTTGSFATFESPNRRQWSLVAQNTGAYRGQRVVAQRLQVNLRGGLARGAVHVWATKLWSHDPAKWFMHLPDVHPTHGTFSYRIPPGYAVSFTSRSDVVRRAATHAGKLASAPAALPASWTAHPDATGMPTYLSPIDGAFGYRPCLGGRSGSCLEQQSTQPPVYWVSPTDGPRVPYAVVGDNTWHEYDVAADVLFTQPESTAGLISRFTGFGVLTDAHDSQRFDGYEFTLRDDGTWTVYRNSRADGRTVLGSGTVAAPGTGTWHRLELSASGSTLAATVDGRRLATLSGASWSHGLAGVESNWSRVQYDDLTVD